MEIVYHLGAHFTDEDRLPKCLLKNRHELSSQGIIIPWPRHYRYLFRDLLTRLNGEKATPEMQGLILDAVMQQDDPLRVVFSHDAFLGTPEDVLGQNQLYPSAAERVVALRNIFPDNPVSLCLGVRNPATLIPALIQASETRDYASYMGQTDPRALRWSEMIARLRAALPDCPVTIWCNEDTPVIWPVLLRAIAGHDPETKMVAMFDFLATLMTPEGAERMKAYFNDHPPASEARRRRAVSAFLEKFGIPEQIEMELDLPGWSDDLVAQLTEAYDADIAEAAGLPGVTLVS